jgi:hypothetical protein
MSKIDLIIDALECAVSDEFFELGKYEAALAAARELKASKLMFWNCDQPEDGPHPNLYTAVIEELNNGDPQIGNVLQFQQALVLPNVKVEITAIYDDDIEYKLLDEVTK